MTTILYQMTDLHIRERGKLAYGRLDTSIYLKRAIETISLQAQTPDAIILTGDLTDFGRPNEYDYLKSILNSLPYPIYMLVGNHDNIEVMRQTFSNTQYLGDRGPLNYSVKIDEIQLIALDTTVPNESFGQLTIETLEWLELELNKHIHLPVIIAMHHPPFQTLIGHMDEIGITSGSEQFRKIIETYSNIERIICGHLHRSISVRFGNTIASTCPSPAHQVVLDLDPKAQSQWNLEPGGVHVHAWNKNHGLVSHVLPVGNFEGPYPFYLDGQIID